MVVKWLRAGGDDATVRVRQRPVDRPDRRATQLARRADLVRLHAPGGAPIVDESWLRRARRGAVIVNTARADLIDETEVASALRDGRLAAFAADVLDRERNDAPNPLLADDLADRVTGTPHIAAHTTEAVDAMSDVATRDVLAVLAGHAPAHTVKP